MKRAKTDFDITSFSRYKDVKGQYTVPFIRNSRCVKISETEDSVSIAVSEKFCGKIALLESMHSPKKLDVKKVRDSDFAEFIGSFVENVPAKETAHAKDAESYSLDETSSDAPVVNIINAICLEAIRKNASDIHIQSEKNTVKVRFRLDGVLQTVKQLDKEMFGAVVSRIKVMAGLNVMENRLCQDGRMPLTADGKNLDFRVSIVPAVTGQNIVLRLFKTESESLSLKELGFSDDNLAKINSALHLPYGMLLATGPTGSGKSTTLHAMLKEMNKEHLKIVTIEDPVEKQMDGIEQIQVNNEIGLTFENILRRILRHDPDVIMVGEIRDKETAELAVRSALTGHLILSTLHTNDSVSAVTRLKNLGIEPYLISGVLRMCLAQRLVRKTCAACGGSRCSSCNFTGYSGRTAVSEVFVMNETAASMIEDRKSDAEIKLYLFRHGFVTLQQDAQFKIKSRITTESEIIREGLI